MNEELNQFFIKCKNIIMQKELFACSSLQPMNFDKEKNVPVISKAF